MNDHDPLLQILILLAASVCVVAAVRKLALPAILGYLAVGMALGPHALALASDNETTRQLADFGVVFLVFTLGLEFSLPRLIAMRSEVLGVGGAQVSLTAAIVAMVAILAFKVAPPVAVVIGGAVAMSSPSRSVFSRILPSPCSWRWNRPCPIRTKVRVRDRSRSPSPSRPWPWGWCSRPGVGCCVLCSC